MQIDTVNPYDIVQRYAMADPQFGGSGANSGIPQLLIHLQCMIWELDIRFSDRIGYLDTNFSARTVELKNSFETLKDDLMNQFVPRISKIEDSITVHGNRLNDVEVVVHAIRNEAEAATKGERPHSQKCSAMSAGEDLVGICCNIATAIDSSIDFNSQTSASLRGQTAVHELRPLKLG
jgi:hypothetical protein